MAVDPLSGNGIFQSLSSALQAPVVINTLLRRPERAVLALQFHQARVEQLFLRFARIGRDFYAQEQGRAEHTFWARRRAWPDAQPMHAEAHWQAVQVARRPVLRDGLVEEAEVVVTRTSHWESGICRGRTGTGGASRAGGRGVAVGTGRDGCGAAGDGAPVVSRAGVSVRALRPIAGEAAKGRSAAARC